MKICGNFTKKIGIKNFADMDNINYLLTEKNKFIYLNKKIYIETYKGFREIDKDILSVEIVNLLSNKQCTRYLCKKKKKKYNDLLHSYFNINLKINNYTITDVNYNNTVNFLKDNIYFQLERYEINDFFWETIMFKIKKIDRSQEGSIKINKNNKQKSIFCLFIQKILNLIM